MMRKITKVAVLDALFAAITYEELPNGEESKGAKFTRDGKDHIHGDFADALAELNIHLATKCEQGSYTEFEDDRSLLESYKVTGISIGGDDEHRGITIIGQRRLKTNEVINLITPFIKFDPNHSSYSYSRDVEEIANKILTEADLHINGKVAPSAQLSLLDTPEQVAEKENHAKRGRQRRLKVEEPGMADEGMAVASM